MEIILSKNCQSLTGTISRSHGYSVRRTGERYFGIRSTRGSVPPDGHWRFILSIAHLAPANLIVADIRLPGLELIAALNEADYPFSAMDIVETGAVYSATDVLELEKRLTEFLSVE
jgi:hypothetical protein